MKATTAMEHGFAPGRSGWVQLIEGEPELNGKRIQARDGAAISDVGRLSFKAAKDSHFLLFDLN